MPNQMISLLLLMSGAYAEPCSSTMKGDFPRKACADCCNSTQVKNSCRFCKCQSCTFCASRPVHKWLQWLHHLSHAKSKLAEKCGITGSSAAVPRTVAPKTVAPRTDKDTFAWKTYKQVTWTTQTSSTRKRGIVLLLATHVPVPKLYIGKYGAKGKGKPHDSLIPELVTSIRTHTKLPVVVILDEQPAPDLVMRVDGYILMQFNVTRAWREKIPALLETPFKETLYMDADMKVCQDVEPLFDVLSAGSDMGMVRVVPQGTAHTWNKPAHSFDFYGCFILFRKSRVVYNIFQQAMTYAMPDQEALNTAMGVVVHRPNVYTFPAAVAAICRYKDLTLSINGPVYTIHGVHTKCSDINKYQGSRYIRCAHIKDQGILQSSERFEVMKYSSVHPQRSSSKHKSKHTVS